MTYSTIKVEREGPIGILTLNQPENRNALTPELMQEYRKGMEELGSDDSVRAVILTAAGKSFCSGAHFAAIAEQAQMAPAERHSGIRWVYDTLLMPRRLRVPVVAAVNGHAIGAGAVLAISCDLVLAAEGAKLGLGFVKLGLYPGVGASYFLPRILGIPKAFELMTLGDVLGAKEAVELGLIRSAVPGDALMTEAKKLAGRLAAGPPVAIRMVKYAIYRNLETPLEAVLEYDAHAQALAATTEDVQEGLKATLEKREPVFQGK